MLISDIQKIDEPVVLTVGSFDGIHKGHIALFETLKRAAKRNNAKSLIITFFPHPRKVVDPEFNMKLLTDLGEKKKIIDRLNIDILIVIEFTKEFSKTSPVDFYEKIILDKFDVKHIVTGFNHHFGNNRQGDNDFIKNLAEKRGITTESVDPIIYQDEPISSSRIREEIIKGNLKKANEMLGYPFCVESIIEEGKKVGRQLGYPTANIYPKNPDKLIPKSGVYLTKIDMMNGDEYYGMTNVGYKPTFEDKKQTIETHIFDFSEDIYGQEIRVSFLKHIRDEIKFSSVDNLKTQLKKDEVTCKNLIQNKVFA